MSRDRSSGFSEERDTRNQAAAKAAQEKKDLATELDAAKKRNAAPTARPLPNTKPGSTPAARPLPNSRPGVASTPRTLTNPAAASGAGAGAGAAVGPMLPSSAPVSGLRTRGLYFDDLPFDPSDVEKLGAAYARRSASLKSRTIEQPIPGLMRISVPTQMWSGAAGDKFREALQVLKDSVASLAYEYDAMAKTCYTLAGALRTELAVLRDAAREFEAIDVSGSGATPEQSSALDAAGARADAARARANAATATAMAQIRIRKSNIARLSGQLLKYKNAEATLGQAVARAKVTINSHTTGMLQREQLDVKNQREAIERARAQERASTAAEKAAQAAQAAKVEGIRQQQVTDRLAEADRLAAARAKAMEKELADVALQDHAADVAAIREAQQKNRIAEQQEQAWLDTGKVPSPESIEVPHQAPPSDHIPPPFQTPPRPEKYIVKSGNSWWQISDWTLRAVGLDPTGPQIKTYMKALQEANTPGAAQYLQIGRELTLPSPADVLGVVVRDAP